MKPDDLNAGQPDDRPPDPQDLDWLAYRYVTGEMSGDELSVWELRLADDQAAREAVAAAVELLQAVIRVPVESWAPPSASSVSIAGLSSVSPSSARALGRKWRPVLWMAAAAAVVLVAAHLGWWNLFSGRPAGDVAGDRDGEASSELALVWSQTRQSGGDSGEDSHDADSDSDADEWSANGDDERATSTTPSWVTAAMADLQPPDDSPPGAEPSSSVQEL